MSTTPNLVLPYLAAGQAQKHVTLNESLRALDALVQMAVVTRGLASPPAGPVEGARYLVPAAPSGAFSGYAGQIAAFQDGGWNFYAPRMGWLCWVADEALLLAFNGTTWAAAGGQFQNLPFVGINATADTTNRLSLAAAASLFNHAGGGHQLKVNKAAASDTASLLFQTAFSGRAELGLAGSDAFALKLSANGSSWMTALSANSSALYLGPNLVPLAAMPGNAAMEVCHGYTGDRYAYFDFHAADAQPDYSARVVRDAGVNGSFRIEEAGASGLRLQAGNASATVAVDIAGVNRHYTTVNGLMPGVDNAFTLGGSGARWAAIWAANGVIQTSDHRDKLVDAPLAPKRAGAVVDAVAPVLFRWKEGSTSPEVTRRETRPMNPANPDSKTIEICEVAEHRRPGKRQHAGFLAQEIKAALEAEGLDFGVWGIEQPEDPESRQWLRPDQMIPLLWAALQETRAELRRLATKKG